MFSPAGVRASAGCRGLQRQRGLVDAGDDPADVESSESVVRMGQPDHNPTARIRKRESNAIVIRRQHDMFRSGAK